MVYSQRRKGRKQKTFFIAAATAHHEGSLRDYVEHVLGPEGFVGNDVENKIRPEVVRRIGSGKCLTHGSTHVCPNETTQRRARLALVLQKIRERNKHNDE